MRLLLSVLVALPLLAAPPFQSVRPLIAKYCVGCHSGANPAAQFDLNPYDTVDSVLRDYPHWSLVLDRLNAREMPPKEAPQPPAEARRQIISFLENLRAEEIRKNVGDPGPVPARRLSNSEYNYTIRDLTGVDLRPAREFPVDPANLAGFDNSGESLTISPGLMTKYLDAARQVADHLVLKPNGFGFSNYPMLVETDRERYAIQRIVAFYDRQPTRFADYFEAAWLYKHRAPTSKTLVSLAAERKVSPAYLAMVWKALETNEEIGPLARLQAMWRELPAQPEAAHEACLRMGDFVTRIRSHTEKLFDPPAVPGLNANFQPFTVWRDREIAAHRREFDPSALRVEGEPPPVAFIVTRGPTFGKGEQVQVNNAIAAFIKDRGQDPDLVVPAGQRARYESAFARFGAVFPTGFALRERGRFYPINSIDKGRYLGAGFHNVMGYFRDDATLSELILDHQGRKELDTLWQEFDFIADYTIRTWRQFIFNGGFGGVRGAKLDRPTFEDSTKQTVIEGIRDENLKAISIEYPAVRKAFQEHFDLINTQIRQVERARAESEPRHLEALLDFATRAYRRPLARDEREEILAYYRELREKGNLSHEEAIRGSVTSLLVSPDFLYHVR